MAILSLDDYIASTKQNVIIRKTATMTTVSANYGDPLHIAGNPGAGTLAGASTDAGIVPTDGYAGFPAINTFGEGAVGYITGVKYRNNIACNIKLVDVLFKAGAYAFNAATTLSSQPSYSSRVPGGTNFGGLELWIEAVTAFTGNQSIAVTYTNQSGVTNRTTGTVATGVAPIVGRMLQLPLQSGDYGVQKIESVTSTISTVGTFNVLVVRPLWEADIRTANGGGVHSFIETGMPQVFDNSALAIFVAADSTNTGIPSVTIEIANK